MNVLTTTLSGLLLLEPKTFGDSRGRFFESWNDRRFREAGIAESFVQDNVSVSSGRVVRGFHFQRRFPQGQLVFLTEGAILDVCLDIRPGSATFGKWESFELTAETARQVYMPPGFAHGFALLSERATVHYKCTDYYRPDDEGGIVWNDPTLAVPWPIADPVISARDAAFPSFAEHCRRLEAEGA
ncbi:dTDP-4-dehydrorhamnose 3,5-epimerase [Paramagnetospirillum marisnigri]|uniref:dTDP-4-dehydrorhamnose 3,5-epimerase n=1 Tax=Paramagnetospirillum marisnigri TaxID=1285242 RepID=A0A178MWM0_9PROT|nr:dTDP-4-dehydrorhamnose 3,5-epimerase [Paramagnetospirillum marisnigri]OAN54658.1 dTDP-4-dehydrorhamnose 3,5-epimerase [Paramagnetospirillum marisnigri]